MVLLDILRVMSGSGLWAQVDIPEAIFTRVSRLSREDSSRTARSIPRFCIIAL